jgi:hypothetical protein
VVAGAVAGAALEPEPQLEIADAYPASGSIKDSSSKNPARIVRLTHMQSRKPYQPGRKNTRA